MVIIDRINQVRDHFMALPPAARALAGAVSGVLVLCLLSALTWFGSVWVASAQQIDALEPRVAQILGFIESEQKLLSTLAERDALLLKMVLPDSGESGRGGAVLQERVRNLSADAGLTVIGSEVLEPEETEDITKLTLSTKVAGPPEALINFFRQLDQERPFLFVSSFVVNAPRQIPRSARRGGQSSAPALTVDINVYAYQMAAQ